MSKKLSKKVHSAIVKKYEALVESALANIAIYESNMVGIGEHSIITETIEEEYKKLDSANSMLETLNNHPIG
jgi:hypothetical protein